MNIFGVCSVGSPSTNHKWFPMATTLRANERIWMKFCFWESEVEFSEKNLRLIKWIINQMDIGAWRWKTFLVLIRAIHRKKSLERSIDFGSINNSKNYACATTRAGQNLIKIDMVFTLTGDEWRAGLVDGPPVADQHLLFTKLKRRCPKTSTRPLYLRWFRSLIFRLLLFLLYSCSIYFSFSCLLSLTIL